MEKAYAKLNGNYLALQGGSPSTVMNAFTGTPNKYIRHSSSTDEGLLKFLAEANKDNFMATTATSG